MEEKDSGYKFEEFDIAWKEFFKNKPKPRSDQEDRKQQEEFCYWYNHLRKQGDTGKTPAEMNSRMIEFNWDDDGEEDSIDLKELLIPENEKILSIEKLRSNDVKKYSGVLSSIELSIAEFYLDNRKLTDLQVISALENFIDNLFAQFDYIKNPLENEIQFGASVGAQRKRISLHELKLCIKFIIESIKNRNYLQDDQAYLKWVTAFFGLLDEKEIKEIENHYKLLASINKIPEKELNFMIKSLHPERFFEE